MKFKVQKTLITDLEYEDRFIWNDYVLKVIPSNVDSICGYQEDWSTEIHLDPKVTETVWKIVE